MNSTHFDTFVNDNQVKKEVVEKTQVTRVNFKKSNMNITSVTHVEQESEFLM